MRHQLSPWMPRHRPGDAGAGPVTFRQPLMPSRRRTRELPLSLQQWTGFAVIVAAHEVEVRYELALRRVGISLRDFAVLSEARQRRGIGQRALAERVGIGCSRLSDQLRRLETEGLVERMLNESDLRRRRVFLTPEGDRALAEARDRIDTADRAWQSGLRITERPAFRALLERLLAGARHPSRGYRAAT
jgi:DNA-binding MarR family transcriptional regulator